MNLLKSIRSTNTHLSYKRKITGCIYFASLALAQTLKGAIVAEFHSVLYIFFIAQFFGSTIQGSISDIYKRSTVLNWSLIITAILLFTVLAIPKDSSQSALTMQTAFIILIGALGNVDVVGRAGAIDIYPHVDRRKLMSWTIFYETLPWVLIGFLMRILKLNAYDILHISLISCALIFVASLFFNIDTMQDKKHLKNTFHEINIVWLKNKKLLVAASVILIFTALGYFFFFYSQEDAISKTADFLIADSYLAWFISMALGSVFVSRIKKSRSDIKIIILSIVIMLVSVGIYILCNSKPAMAPAFFGLDMIIYGIGGLGAGIFLPCIYSLVSKGHSSHIQGVLTGWVDSLRVFGDMAANVTLYRLAVFSIFNPYYFSAFCFIISIFFSLIKMKNMKTTKSDLKEKHENSREG